MESDFTYKANDARYLSVIEDLNSGMDILEWLCKYLNLYMNVTYGPEDLPRIADCNYNGKMFEGILEFVTIFICTNHQQKQQ